MCGRFTIKTGLEDLLEAFPFLVAPDEEDVADVLAPRYNVAPTQPVPAARGSTGARIESLRWGLVPFFAKDPSIGSRMINARSETVAEKPAFREPFRERRCLVLADGFYEWRKNPDGKTKTPIHLRLRGGRPFAFAGLWDRWRPRGPAAGAGDGAGGSGEEILSCTILTTEPNEFVRPIHDRMPVMLVDADAAARWLDPKANREALEELFGAPPAEAMESWPVSTIVNSPRNETPRCVERGGQATLFD